MLYGFPPKVFIIGAQKSGTTSLASLLQKNSEVCLSNPKEPNYYTMNYQNGSQWYRSCFDNVDKILVDASTTYTMCPLSEQSLNHKPERIKNTQVPQRIYKDAPDAKLVYVIRDPVSRMYSNYWHNMKYGYENRAFLDAIQNDPLYKEMSLYYEHLNLYMRIFPRENILLLKFEDLITNQRGILNLCEKFIGVPETVVLNVAASENQGGVYGERIKNILRNDLVKNVEKIMPDKLKSYIKSKIVKKIPKLEDEIRRDLQKIFINDQKALSQLFNIAYSDYL